jgi:hypothetical protein
MVSLDSSGGRERGDRGEKNIIEPVSSLAGGSFM